jgi:hypothetical protein
MLAKSKGPGALQGEATRGLYHMVRVRCLFWCLDFPVWELVFGVIHANFDETGFPPGWRRDSPSGSFSRDFGHGKGWTLVRVSAAKGRFADRTVG